MIAGRNSLMHFMHLRMHPSLLINDQFPDCSCMACLVDFGLGHV